ncbi:chalcone isomerase family protein [Gammaproteobacteria bacterium]|nr:chalcone isomerase family protein [Gammaproteobacteria bacterium]
MRAVIIMLCLIFNSTQILAAEVSGVFIDAEIKDENGELLTLNGAGLREKFWIDVYVGSLYLPSKTNDVAEILSKPESWRIQLDFVYKEVARQKLLDSWREGFEKNQTAETLQQLQSRISAFYRLFDSSAVARDQYWFDYQPGIGTRVSKNQQSLGVIPGEDFASALLEIWLGNHPADKSLKKAMLGL